MCFCYFAKKLEEDKNTQIKRVPTFGEQGEKERTNKNPHLHSWN
jgi:hypothetical protein